MGQGVEYPWTMSDGLVACPACWSNAGLNNLELPAAAASAEARPTFLEL